MSASLAEPEKILRRLCNALREKVCPQCFILPSKTTFWSRTAIVMHNTLGFVETPYEIAEFMVKLASVPRDAPVLDTGFGRGVFLRALLNQGYTCISGIEIQSDFYALGKKLYGFKGRLIQGDFLS